MLDVRKAVVVVFAVLDKGCSRNPKSWLFRKPRHEEFEVIGLERDICIEIADDIEREVTNGLESRVEALYLRSEIPFPPLWPTDQLDPVVLLLV
jgi:hypothetical protein